MAAAKPMLHFRQFPETCRRVALTVAVVIFLLATVGEAFHYAHHTTPPRSLLALQQAAQGRQHRAAIAPAPKAAGDFCAFCEWKAAPSDAPPFLMPFALDFALLLLPAFLVIYPLALVRQRNIVQNTRGPPCLAV